MLDQISSLIVEEPGLLSDRGYIQFCLVGQPQTPIGQYHALSDEHSVTFGYSDYKVFAALVRALETKLVSLLINQRRRGHT